MRLGVRVCVTGAGALLHDCAPGPRPEEGPAARHEVPPGEGKGPAVAVLLLQRVLLGDSGVSTALSYERGGSPHPQVFPTSGQRSTSLWDVADVEALQVWLDDFLEVDCTNEVYEVGTNISMHKPPQDAGLRK